MNVMWTYLLAVGTMLGSAPTDTQWPKDYRQALDAARSNQRPMLVVLEDHSAEEGKLTTLAEPASPALRELLASYEVCSIDVNTERGASVARAFRAERYPYSAITDSSCEFVVFRGVGQFSESAWANMLADYKGGARVEKITVNKPLLNAVPRKLFAHADIGSALAAARDVDRPIFAYVTMPGCYFCEKMKAETLEDPMVNQTLTENFESVIIDQQTDPAWIAEQGVRVFPATIILGQDGRVIDRLEGFVSSQTLLDRLRTSEREMLGVN